MFRLMNRHGVFFSITDMLLLKKCFTVFGQYFPVWFVDNLERNGIDCEARQ